ncbi:hypothetical protein K438DRAFT_1993391 [Mycena galopus ATCC 62051]|nr:hypothetical protein K438DRAFT_1993391 [Mycena galopus ATCC 62051]
MFLAHACMSLPPSFSARSPSHSPSSCTPVQPRARRSRWSSSSPPRTLPTLPSTETSDGGLNWSTSSLFAATHLPACNGYARLIRVLAISHPRLIASIYQVPLNLSLPFLCVRPFRHTSPCYNHSDTVGRINSLNGVLGYVN